MTLAWLAGVTGIAGCASPHGQADPRSSGPVGGEVMPEEVEQVLTEMTRTMRGVAGDGASDHRINPGDLLDVTVFDAPELSRAIRVSSQGAIAMPLLGIVPAAGSTPEDLAADLEERLRERYMREPNVSVQVTEVQPRSIYVLGEVRQPGSFLVNDRDGTTVLQAVAMGGGVSELAAMHRAVLIRSGGGGERTQIPVDLSEVLNGGGSDERMLPNDILFVPKSAPRSFIRGALNTITRIITFRAIF